jgi:starch synthase
LYLRIAIARGINFNRFEMQSYEPLAVEHELTGYASYANNFEVDGISFTVKRLHTADEYYRFFPGPLKSLAYGLSLREGWNQRMFGLEKALEDKDIIHTAETSTGYSYQAARVKEEKKNKKLVVTVWENIPFLSTHQFMGFDNIPLLADTLREGLTGNGHIVKYVKDRADILMAVTERAKVALMMEGVPEEKIRVRPMGVDVQRFKPAPPDPSIRDKLGVGSEDFVVLFVGRLGTEKGVYDLVYAARLMALDPDMGRVKLVMAGAGPEKGRLAGLVESLGLRERVKLVGPFPYGQVPMLYNASDAFILPSIPVPFWQEQFGMVLAEAMASGLPVISTHSGSIPEVVGDAGALVQPNDPLSIRAEVKKLYADPVYRDRAGKVARRRALDAFTVEKAAAGIEAIYRELS